MSPAEAQRADPVMEDLTQQQQVLMSSHARSRSPNYGVKGRSTFIPKSETVNAEMLLPNDAMVRVQPPRTPFGTSTRDKETARYISALHSAGLPPGDTPGPGTYRVQVADRYPHSPKRGYSPAFGFGSAPQRPDERQLDAAQTPGPIYDLPTDRSPQAFSFAPMNSPELGAGRSRADGSKMYISPLHSSADRTAAQIDGVGPGQYDLIDPAVLSPKRRSPDIRFGTANKDAKNSFTPMQLASEPMATTAAHTPGAVYDLPGLRAGGRSPSPDKSPKFGTAPRSFTPQPGGGGAGPYISRLHELAQLGTLSPGPGSYSVVATSPRNKAVSGWLGDAPTPSFGTGPQAAPTRAAFGPGPGAYSPNDLPLSRATTAPCITMGPALRTDFSKMCDPDVPGPGTYDVAQSSRADGQRQSAPSFSLGVYPTSGRSSFVVPTCTPGPAMYSHNIPGAMDTSKGRGYSFGLKEKTVSPASTISVRYHGPLAAQEALGTQSPGPGMYDVRASAERQSAVKRTPDITFGSAARQSNARIYISKLHAEADGAGVDSPGPGAYNHGDVSLEGVTSRYRKPSNVTFGTGERFKSNYLTF